MRQTRRVDFDTVADELYGLPLQEFTAARNAQAKQAKAAGEASLAKQVQALRKPSMAAWLINQLVRRQSDELTVLVELGTELRAGLSGLTGDELRQLTKQRYQLVSALVQQALSVVDGQRVSNEVAGAVRETLEATLSDAASAEAVQAGRLAEALHVSGFGAGFGAPAVVLDDVSAGGGGDNVVDIAEHRDRRALAREQAEARVEEAESESENAAARLEEAEEQVKAAEEAQQETAARVRRLQEDLTRASNELEKRTEAAARKRGQRDDAATDAQEAAYDLADAREALRRLNG